MLVRLIPGSPWALQRLQLPFFFLWEQTRNIQLKSADVIDGFTDELVNKKSRKWQDLRSAIRKKSSDIGILSKGILNDLQDIRSPKLGLDVCKLSRPQIDSLLLSTLDNNKVDFLFLIRQCIQWKCMPSHDVLIACLKYLSSLGRLQQIASFEEICRRKDPSFCQKYANFEPFKVMAHWRCGRAELALQTLQKVYKNILNSEESKKLVRIACCIIAEETLTQKSEAVLVQLMEFAHAIHEEHKDIFVLACIWKQCFFSDWFCDQKIAGDLFEQFRELQQLVAKQSSSLLSSFLVHRNVDAVHRLIEILLQKNEKIACTNCLSLLFNYQYLRKDLRACAEIIKSCRELKMPLSEMQNEQFLNLFLDQTGLGTAGMPEPKTPCLKSSSKKPEEYQYRF